MTKALERWASRFEAHPDRHEGITLAEANALLDETDGAWDTLRAMEESGGEPDIIRYEEEWLLVDMAKESPIGRRSLCYDEAARRSRKKVPPKTSVEAMARELGVELVDEALYRHLQSYGPLDTKTSSWIATPHEVRALGGALFGDHRYGRTFVYHNGADSYYGARGFRGFLRLR